MSGTKPVKVVYCETNVDGTIGGSYYSLLYLVKGLDRTKFDPTVVFYREHALLSTFRDAGIRTLVWPRPAGIALASRAKGPLAVLRLPLLVLQRALNVLRFVGGVLSRAWFLISRRIDVVHLNNSIMRNHDWMLAANLTGRRCITHERGINDRYTSGAKYLGKRLDAVICISEAVRRNMVEGGADFGNLVTIYNGLDPAVMRVGTPADELRRRHGLRPEHAIVGMPGNIRAWKGQDTLVRAMDLVRRECPNARCLLIGDMAASDRPYGDMLAELASSLGLQDYIILTGFQKNVADYLNLCDVVVHASVRPEPFGRVILDAMACRKPVVGSRAGAIPEIIEEGKTGLTFPPGDSEQLARAIITLIKDRSAARRLGENGYQRLIEQFNIDRNVDATVRLYGRLLGAAH